MGFLVDTKTEEAMREGLADATSETLDLRRGNIRTAIAAMQKIATPRVLIVDITGDEQPLSALGELAHVVEPDVCVLVVGEVEHADFYREITRGMGAAEYLSKPITRDKVLRHFGPFVQGSAFATPAMLGGRAIAVIAVRMLPRRRSRVSLVASARPSRMASSVLVSTRNPMREGRVWRPAF